MKTITQKYIARQMGVSPTFINYLVNGIKRPSWKRAKQLAKLTDSTPELWLDGTPDQIKQIFNQNINKEHNDTGEKEHGKGRNKFSVQGSRGYGESNRADDSPNR